MILSTSINSLPRTSSITIRRLHSVGVNTFEDLLNYFPIRYLDFSLKSTIDRVQPGETVTLGGKIIKSQNQYAKSGLKIQKIIIADQTGQIEATWYNQPYLLRLFKNSQKISVAGEVQKFGNKLTILPQEYQLGENQIHTGRIIPVYSEKKGLSSRVIREKIFWLLEQLQEIEETLPKEIVNYNQLIDRQTAYQNIHFPKNKNIITEAKKRLSFDELFIIQLSNSLVKKNWEKQTVGHPFIFNKVNQEKLQEFMNKLPFKLTSSQKKAINEIIADLSLKKPMNRFLQGDVGSGKTVVAAIACYLAYLNGYQSLFMAPTEILANQHFNTIKQLFESQINKKNPAVSLITSSKYKVSSIKYKNKTADIIIGTHALLNEKLKFDKVGLVVIDEQQRFGVTQRAILQNKGVNPHLLTMTATPIPRTVALTLYGELDLSYLEEMPSGRLPVKTYFVRNEKRMDCYYWIKSQITQLKSQVFIVCPLIEESDVETMKSVKAVQKEYDYLKNQVFTNFKVGLLHGKMKPKEKDKVMSDFKNKIYDILIATPVVEVGIDISNATIMIIEAAERYGLASLHQLRGRVGRGNKQSYCFLFTEKSEANIIKRLQFFAKTNSGQLLAEYDLNRRGPGTIFGTKQYGFLNLKIASLTDFKLIQKTKSAVNYFLSHYKISDYQLLDQQVKNLQSIPIASN